MCIYIPSAPLVRGKVERGKSPEAFLSVSLVCTDRQIDKETNMHEHTHTHTRAHAHIKKKKQTIKHVSNKAKAEVDTDTRLAF